MSIDDVSSGNKITVVHVTYNLSKLSSLASILGSGVDLNGKWR